MKLADIETLIKDVEGAVSLSVEVIQDLVDMIKHLKSQVDQHPDFVKLVEKLF